MTDQELLQAIGQIIEAKVEPLRQDIHDVKDGVQRLEVRMDQLETRMDQLEARMDKLETRMDQLEARVDDLEDKVRDIRIYMDTEQRQTLNLLLEGQQALWDRFVPYEEFDPLEGRTEVLELTVRRHSQEIRELQFA